MRTCSVCKAPIDDRPSHFKTCSTFCSAERNRERQIKRNQLSKKRRRAREKAERLTRDPKQCGHCGSDILGRSAQAKFCCQECLIESTNARAKAQRLANKPVRECRWCSGQIGSQRKATAAYCCDHCQYLAEKKREREKIARYRATDPERYQVHRNKENELRAQARSALKLIKEIETKGLEALL